MTDKNWSKLEEGTVPGGAVPFDADLSTVERTLPAGNKSGARSQLTSPQTVCHVRVTVRHRSPRRSHERTAASIQTDSPDATPVPALRRAGTASKRSSPAGRKVTFSELPPATVDERRPMFTTPRFQHNTISHPALDTLWHYHEIYPCMDSRHMGQSLRNVNVAKTAFDVSSAADGCVPETPRNENEIENENDITQQPGDALTSINVDSVSTSEHSGELTRHRDSYSHSHADDDDNDNNDDDNNQQQQQQGSKDDSADESEEASLSIEQLVASFESMTSPYMRAPMIARRPEQ